MKRYEPSIPRAAAAIAALAMTVVTFGLAIVVPVALAPEEEARTVTTQVAPTAIERVAIVVSGSTVVTTSA